MTAKNRPTIKAVFEQGDKPQGSDYEDMIDSYLSVADTTAQSLSSPLSVPGALGASTTVSAPAGEFTVVSADSIIASAASFTEVSAASLIAATARVTGDLHVVGNVSVSGSIDFPGRSEGEVFIEVTAAVSASVVFVDVVTVATGFSVFLMDFEVTAGSLKYTGTTEKNFMASTVVSLACSANNVDTHIRIAIDGSALARLEAGKELGTVEDELSVAGLVRLATGERVSTMMQSDDSNAKGYTIHDFILTVRE